jgi:transglutaminase-like putative cysteine protease
MSETPQLLRPPPLLVGAALVFWGWQSDLFVVAGIMAVVVESAHLLKARWEFSDKDFSRIWAFCSLLFLGAAVFAFSDSGAPSEFGRLLRDVNLATERNAGNAAAKTTASLFRWLPIVFFPLLAVQTFSTRQCVPLESVSVILRRRSKKAAAAGKPKPAPRLADISFIYFSICLFAASVNTSENLGFFWGLCTLLSWALWTQRSRRYGLVAWGTALLLAVSLGYAGQRGFGLLQSYLGNLNPQWLSAWTHRRFDPTHSRTEIGKIGRVKASGSIVIRLETETGAPPSVLREASYRTYKARSWYADVAEKDFDDLRSETNETSYVLVRDKTNLSSVHVGCYLDGRKGLLPLPEGTGRLDDLMVISLKRNGLGAVLADGPGLALFQARYGPGATHDSGPSAPEDLDVPPLEADALDQVLAQLNLKGKPPETVARELTRFFLANFNYSTWQDAPPRAAGTNETPLGRFLLQTRSGHCEYFATAGTLLLRAAGIPARYAVGYVVHEGSGHKYVVRQRDAHAWCLYWDQQASQWRDLDLTPASWLDIERKRAPAFQFLSDLWSRLMYEFSRFRWGPTNVRGYLLWALIPMLAVLLWQIIFRSRRRARRRGAGSGRELEWPGGDSEFYRFEKLLAARGVPREPAEALSDWLQRALKDPALGDLQVPLRELVRLHYKYRFDPAGITPEERDQLRRSARECIDLLDHARVQRV